MLIYYFNRDTGEYLISKDADINPLEMKRMKVNENISYKHFKKPACGTFIPPPPTSTNEVACFSKEGETELDNTIQRGEWKVLKDFRGKEGYLKENGEKIFINKIDIDLEDILAVDLAPDINLKEPSWDEENSIWVENAIMFREYKLVKENTLDLLRDKLTKLPNELLVSVLTSLIEKKAPPTEWFTYLEECNNIENEIIDFKIKQSKKLEKLKDK